MKILFCILMLSYSLCISQKSSQAVTLDDIATSKEYGQLMEIRDARRYALATFQWNAKEIMEVFDNSLALSSASPCEIKSYSHPNVMGIDSYLKIECLDMKALARLDKKYDYRSLSLEERLEIQEIYAKTITTEENERKIKEIYNALLQKQ